MKRIAILGVGLIGGSLALSLQQETAEIIGFDVDEENLRKAESLGVIHKGTTHLAEAVEAADVIFLCSPVGKLFELLSFLRYTPLKPGAIITDTGSTKNSVMDWAKDFYQKGAYFIGGHPMAGSHKSGVEAATDHLFENAYYVLTPDSHVPGEVVNSLKGLLRCTRAKVVVMQPAEHDQIVGAISHFPHILAAALVKQVEQYSENSSWYYQLAAGGFRDLTRIASSNPRMWRDILLNNRNVLLSLAEDWQQVMGTIVRLIKEGEGEAIERFFQEAHDFRNQLPERKKGAMAPMYDLFVDIPDHPGIIGKITTFLGNHEISIINLRILETREDIFGVLQITFRDEADLDKAKQVLPDLGYRIYSPE